MDDAKRRAAELRVKVDGLRKQAEIATEDYNASYESLGKAVTAHLLAKQRLDEVRVASGGADSAAERRVRALYMSGGVPALYAKILDSGSISDFALRVHHVNVVLSGDQKVVREADQAVAEQKRAEQELAVAAKQATRLQSQVADRADKVRALLGEADQLLAAADQRVRDIADQQRRAAEAAAAARAAAAFAGSGSNTGPDQPAVAASPVAARALEFARKQLGKPYVWGAVGPASFDCSGLTGAAYRYAGINLPRTSRQQWYAGPHVGFRDLEPGDLLFWATNPSDPGTIHHVTLYAGDGMMVAAPKTGDVVKVQPVYLEEYIGAVRPGASLA
jgi:cell wall-associated NlpC family hydrolase